MAVAYRRKRPSTKGLFKSSLALGLPLSVKCVLQSYVQSCLARGHKWRLEQSEFLRLIFGHCCYCGSPPGNVMRKPGHPDLLWNGIDRIDNTRTYEPGNCVTCCGKCNGMKSALTANEFLEHVKRITEWQSRR